MKFLLALILLCTTTALAQGPVNYPPEVYEMTAAQFKQWADAYNQQKILEWQVKKEKAKADQPQFVQWTVASTQNVYSNGIYGNGGNNWQNWGNYGNYGNYGNNWQNYGSESSIQQTGTFQTDNPKYVNPGPLTLVNPFCRPTPSTAAELVEIKRAYDAAGGYVLTVHSADGTPLHMKVE